MNKDTSDYYWSLGIITFLVIVGWACTSWAGESVKLQTVDLHYQRFVGATRDPLYTGAGPSAAWSLGTSVGLLDVAGVDTEIVAGEDTAFHYGGLHYFAYVRPVAPIQIGWSHQSLHLFDGPTLPGGFPLYNAVEVRVKLFDAGPKPGSLF